MYDAYKNTQKYYTKLEKNSKFNIGENIFHFVKFKNSNYVLCYKIIKLRQYLINLKCDIKTIIKFYLKLYLPKLMK